VLATLRFVDFGDPPAVAAQVGNAKFTPANGGDAGPYASRYGGAAVYPTALATVDTLTVFHPQSFRAFASPLASSVFIDPKSGKQDFVSGCSTGSDRRWSAARPPSPSPKGPALSHRGA